MDHLIGAWRRSSKLERDTPAGRLDERKLYILKESRRIALSYAVYCVTMPEMFGYVLESPKEEVVYVLIGTTAVEINHLLISLHD